MSPWLFNMFMERLFGEVNGWEICYDMAVMSDLGNCKSWFLRFEEFERRKLRISIDMIKVIKFSMGGRQKGWSMSLN